MSFDSGQRPPPPRAPADTLPDNHDWLTPAYEALLGGDRPRAILMVQENTGLDAKSAFEFVEGGKLADAEGRWLAEARAHLDEGHPIQAIKAVREGTGLGLAEAKRLVESPSLREPGYLAVRRRHLLP